MSEREVVSSVKDKQLIEMRRKQMIEGAIRLFKEKGFHQTTTKEIAKESGFSIGTLYEYIRTKEDILFLVCESIYENVRCQLKESIGPEQSSIKRLINVIRQYFGLMDRMQEEVVIMYQEVKTLKHDALEYVLEKEREMVALLEEVITTCLPAKDPREIELVANNIFIQGQMWGFRRWVLQKHFTLDDYIDRQLHLILCSLNINAN